MRSIASRIYLPISREKDIYLLIAQKIDVIVLVYYVSLLKLINIIPVSHKSTNMAGTSEL